MRIIPQGDSAWFCADKSAGMRVGEEQWSTGAPALAPAKITTPFPAPAKIWQFAGGKPRPWPINLSPAPAKNHAFTGCTAGDFMNDFGTFLRTPQKKIPKINFRAILCYNQLILKIFQVFFLKNFKF